MAEEQPQKPLENVVSNFSLMKIGDDSSGTIRRERAPVRRTNEEETFSFYALALPDSERTHSEGGGLVFDNRKEALLSMKSHREGRLKGFPTKEEAVIFSTTPLKGVTTVKDLTRESITPQLLVQLRKTIEKGDDKTFLRNILNNPKLLIGRSDIPAVLQEGTHLNALHIAAKVDKPIICQLVLDILQNKQFLEKLYPHESEKAIEKRKIQLLDLYLNTPEKSLGDTPLHFASKFGSPGCVAILVAHPLCLTNRKNINHKTAEDIICDRVKSEYLEDTKAAIEAAFKNVYYVTISRSDNLLSPPVINMPSVFENIVFDNKEDLCVFKTPLKIKAFSGPMSFKKALSFYETLKYPSTLCYEKPDYELLKQVRKSDPNKGVERVARQLADDFNVDFMEYHEFLNIFANFSKDDGLQVLESFFETRCNERGSQNVDSVSNMPEGPMKIFHVLPHAYINALGHSINVYLKKDEYAVIPTYPEKREKFMTPPSSPESESEYFSASESFGTAGHSPFKSDRDEDLFIEGFKVTKVDVDSLLSLRGRHVDKRKYPLVYDWKRRVENKLSKYQGNHQKMKNLTPMASVAVPRLARLPQMDTQNPVQTELKN